MLGDGEAIVRASMSGAPLVGRVELTSDDESLRAEIEFPIKTMNANDTHGQWQVDTGPIALPDFTGRRRYAHQTAVPRVRCV